MKIRVTKVFPLEMAHALYGYDGPCRNIHGHSYRLEVTLIGTPAGDPSHPKYGMVMDFSDLKKIIRTQIIDRYDHALLLNGNSPHRNLEGIDANFEKVLYVEYQPTCENILMDFHTRIRELMPSGTSIQRMILHETATSSAEWNSDDN